MTLNGKMALILRYLTDIGSFRGALRKSVKVDDKPIRPRYKYNCKLEIL